ncbi:hypothetical protein GCM10023405_26320 [Streptomonospora salina]
MASATPGGTVVSVPGPDTGPGTEMVRTAPRMGDILRKHSAEPVHWNRTYDSMRLRNGVPELAVAILTCYRAFGTL